MMYSNKVISIDELWQFFNFSSSLYGIAGLDGYIKHINPSFTKLLGFTEKEFLSKPYIEFVHPEDRELSLMKVAELIQSGTASFCSRCVSKDGSNKWLSWALSYSEKYEMIYANAQDITESYLLKEKLNQEKLEKQKAILDATIQGQETEKINIGRELHDNVNQLLSIVNLYLDMAMNQEENRLWFLQKAKQIQLEGINEIRTLSKALVTPDTKEIGLIDSIEELLEVLKVKGDFAISFIYNGFKEELPSKVKLMLYRIVQEQTTNILKYAKARNILLLLKTTKEELQLEISDDGVGFEPKKKADGIGFKNIISRTEIYKGQVKINSAPGKGCQLLIAIPVGEIYP